MRPPWLDGPQQPCARCGAPTFSTAATPMHRACQLRSAPRPERSWSERRRRKAAVEAHRAAYGDVCPGFQRAAHVVIPPNVLSADHIVAVARGGAEDGPLQVLCRRCNSSKRDRMTRANAPRAVDAVAAPSPSRMWMSVYPSPSETC